MDLIGFFKSENWVEIAAVLAGLAYVWLAAKEHIACWPFGILNALLSIYLFVNALLYAEAILYGYYVLAGIYGWYAWQRHRTVSSVPLMIHRWPWKKHLQGIFLGVVLSWALGWALDRFTQAQYPFIDAHTTLFSFLATYLVTRKILSNWIYWIFIDLVSAGLYWSRDLQLYAFLMILYTVMSVFGYLNWRKIHQSQHRFSF